MTEDRPAPRQRPAALPEFQPPAREATTATALDESTRQLPALTTEALNSPRPYLQSDQAESRAKFSLFNKAKNGGPTHTATFSEDGPTAVKKAAPANLDPLDPSVVKTAAAAVAGVLVMAGVLAVKYRYQGRRKLREPTPRQIDDVAGPLANLLLRTAGLGRSKNLLEGLAVVGAVGVYLNDGPLTYEAGPDLSDIPTPEGI